MQVKHRDLKSGAIKLKVQTLDDLWHLYNVIELGDLVFALTERREETRADAIRAERGEKKKMKLGVRIEKIEFHEFSDWLRLHGVIEEGKQDIGSYHTLNISVDDDLTIQKDWRPHHLDMLVEAEKSTSRPLITFLAIDDDEATIAHLREYGIKHVATIRSPRSGKFYATKGVKEEDYFVEVIQALKVDLSEGELVIIGPGFAKERIMAYGRDKHPKIFERCHIESTGQCGMAAVNEILKKGVGSKILEDSRVALETQLVEKLLAEISKNGLYAYGVDETRQAVTAGAADTLLATTKKVRSRKYDDILEAAKNAGSKVVIISEVHDAGKSLDALGGIGALLRYKMN